MFNNSHVGREIIIRDTNGAIFVKKDQKYKIIAVANKITVKLQGVDQLWVAAVDQYTFVNKAKNEVNIGEEVLVLKESNSFKNKDKRKVIGYADENPDKLILKGTLPGGWVSSCNVMKLLDLTKYRVLSVIEMYIKIRLSAMVSLGLKDKLLVHIAGKKLSELSAQQYPEGILAKYGDGNIWITDLAIVDYPEEKYEIFIREDQYLRYNKMANGFVDCKTKHLHELKKDFTTDNNANMAILLKEFSDRGYTRDDSGNFLYEEAMKFVKITNKVEEAAPLV